MTYYTDHSTTAARERMHVMRLHQMQPLLIKNTVYSQGPHPGAFSLFFSVLEQGAPFVLLGVFTA